MTTHTLEKLRAGTAGLCLVLVCVGLVCVGLAGCDKLAKALGLPTGEGEPAPPEVTSKFKNFGYTGVGNLVVASYASSNKAVLLKPPEDQLDLLTESTLLFNNVVQWRPVPGAPGWQSGALPPGWGVGSEGELLSPAQLEERKLYGKARGVRLAPTAQPEASSQYAPQQPQLVYEAGANTNTVIVLDPSTFTIVGTIPVGTHPRGLAGTPDGKQVWITNRDSSSISVIDTSTLKVTATIALPSSQPYGIDITPDGTTAYVANGMVPGAVYVVNVAKQSVTSTINVGGRPFKLAVSPDGGQVYVTNNADGTVSVIDVLTNTVIKTITVGAAAFGVAFSPNGSRVYVTANGFLCVIDPSSYQIVATVAVGVYPVSVTVDPTGTEAYVCNRLSTFISHIDLVTNKLIENVDVGFSPEVATLVPLP